MQNTKVKLIYAGAMLIGVIFLWPVFSGQIILPQSLQIGPVAVRYYGLILASAVFCGWQLAKKNASQYGISQEQAGDIIFWLTVYGFLGARVYHILSSFGYYWEYPAQVFKVWQGGLSIYGALIGGIVAALFFARRHSLKAASLLNWLAPSLILGQIIGRFGNLFNYEAFGYPTNLPWKMFVPLGFRPGGYGSFQYFHPWFLYELIGLAGVFLVIRKMQKLGKPALFLYYLLLYNTLRFGLEFLRIDSPYIFNARQNALVSLGLMLIALTALVRLRNAKFP